MVHGIVHGIVHLQLTFPSSKSIMARRLGVNPWYSFCLNSPRLVFNRRPSVFSTYLKSRRLVQIVDSPPTLPSTRKLLRLDIALLRSQVASSGVFLGNATANEYYTILFSASGKRTNANAPRDGGLCQRQGPSPNVFDGREGVVQNCKSRSSCILQCSRIEADTEQEPPDDKDKSAAGGSPLVDVTKRVAGSAVKKPNLMSLPTELRLHILEYLLVAPSGRINYVPLKGLVSGPIRRWPHVLATCSQMYEEAWPLLSPKHASVLDRGGCSKVL